MYQLLDIKKKRFVDNGGEGFLTKREYQWLLLKAEMAEKYEESLYEIKDTDDIDEAQAIAFVTLNHDFED